jgi:hypothetical protein
VDAVGENMILKSRIGDLESERQSAERQAPVVPLLIANDQAPARDAPSPVEASAESEAEAAEANSPEPEETRGRREKKAASL